MSLKEKFFAEYNRDKRRKKVQPHTTFCVDDRSSADIASDGSLYGYFCEIVADVKNDPVVEIRLSKNVPIGPEVKKWISNYGATVSEVPLFNIQFSVAPDEEAKLLELASAIETITKHRYDTPSYKYVCPRTAKSLRRLASVLASSRGT